MMKRANLTRQQTSSELESNFYSGQNTVDAKLLVHNGKKRKDPRPKPGFGE